MLHFISLYKTLRIMQSLELSKKDISMDQLTAFRFSFKVIADDCNVGTSLYRKV